MFILFFFFLIPIPNKGSDLLEKESTALFQGHDS